jgi:hypothetical protein
MKRICIFGYPQEFKSKTDAVLFLLKEGKLTQKQIMQKTNCSYQQIHTLKKKIA